MVVVLRAVVAVVVVVVGGRAGHCFHIKSYQFQSREEWTQGLETKTKRRVETQRDKWEPIQGII